MNEFHTALEKYSIDAEELRSDEIRDRIQQYCVLLWLRNQVMNLTRHTDWETFVARDLIDTLELSQCIDREADVLDIGTGGGVPGLLLAIIRPDLDVTCAESVGKKAKALVEFAESLQLTLQISHDRAESLLNDLRYDFVTARAVGSLSKICTWLQGRWPNVGRLLATKGPRWVDEQQEANAAGLMDDIELKLLREYQSPGAEWKSVILELVAKRAPE